MSVTEVDARAIVDNIAARRREELRSALTQLRGSLEINLSVWSGPEHIPIELLQNADDAFENGAASEDRGSILYIVGENFLLVAHDGPPFTTEDVDYISSIGRPHKKPGRQSGWMDFGFKSVFQLTNCPTILSGPFRFRFEYNGARGEPESILIPLWVNQVPAEAQELYEKGYTIFYLPFRTDVTELGEFCQAIDFAPLSLVFLRHIRRITLQTKHGLKQYTVESVNAGIQTVVETHNGKARSHLFKLFSKSVPIPLDKRSQDRVTRSGRGFVEDTTVSLAFHLDEEHNLASTEGQLYYFVPTSIETGLKFDINGDFLLNAERTAIDRSLRWNEHLLRAAADLVTQAVDTFRTHRQWRYQFYKVLPTGKEAVLDIIEQTIVKSIRDYCQNHPIIISHDNKWLLPSKIAIVPNRLQRVLEPSDINLDGYVNAKVTGIDFIKSLGIADFSGEKEGELIEHFLLKNQAHLSSKPAKWFLKFYSYLGEALFADDPKLLMSRWYIWQEKIRNFPIILTETGNIRPKDAIYPTRSQEAPRSIAKRLKFVHPAIVSSRGSRRILVDSFKTPVFSPASVVENLVREVEEGTSRKWSKKQCGEILRFIHRWLKKCSWEIPTNLRVRLSYLPVPTTNDWVPAKGAYLDFEALMGLLPGAPVVNVPKGSRADWECTLRALGVADFPKVQSMKSVFTRQVADNVPSDVQPKWDVYWEWLGTKEIKLYEYTRYQRLTEIHWAPWLTRLSTLQARTRREALRIILQAWSSYYSNFIGTKYEWFHYNDNQKSVSSYFSWQLRNEEWLPTTMGPMKPGPNVFAPLRQVKVLLGDLVPYIDCDENHAKNARTFLDHIGVKSEVDVEALMSALAYLGSQNLVTEYWTEQRLVNLKELYRALAQQIDEDEPPAFSGLVLLGANKQFTHATSLVWKDDPQIGQAFPDFASYVWVPPIERPLLQRLFLVAGVRLLSALVASSIVGDSSWDAVTWVAKFREKASFLYSLIVHHQPEVAGDILNFLNKEPRVVGHSDLRLKLIWDSESRLVPVPAYFEREDVMLHIASYATASDVAFALAKGLGLPEQTEQVERILIEDQTDLVRRFERWGVAIVSTPDETSIAGKPESDVEEADLPDARKNDGLELVPTGRIVGRDVVTDDKRSVQPIAPDELLDSGTSTPVRLSITKASLGSRRSHIPSVVAGERSADMKARKQAELEAMNVATWFEKNVRGREVRDVSQRESYDLESIDPANPGIVDRHIEVKAHFSSWPVELTDPEKEQARVLGSGYWIYVVTKTEAGYNLYPIQNPIDCTQVDLQEHFTTIWRVVGWETTQPTTAPSDAGLHNW